MIKLSVAIATFNEESNLKECLDSVKNIADEIIIVDGNSEDQTVKIAQSFGAKVVNVPNDQMFHRMKQLSFDKASGEWILYLDADERVSSDLAKEIKEIININDTEINDYQRKIQANKLFIRHQKLIEKRDGRIGRDEGEYTAFFFPRLNYFLGKYLRFGGVYPDGVIRLFKKGKAFLPCQDVHEQLIVDGRVGWLKNNLLHDADPTLTRYLQRNSRYIDLIVDDFKKSKLSKNPWQFLKYLIILPVWWFLLTLIRHKGILDGWQGVVFSFFSALRFPRAYLRYLKYD